MTLDGQGTKEDPYIIETGRQLLIIRHYPDAYFLQTADIDLEELAFKDAKLPISNQTLDDNYFSGVYDGGNNKIYNLKLEMRDQTLIGLFGVLKNKALIKNLHLVNVSINGYLDRQLYKERNNGAILNSESKGEIRGKKRAGGLAGFNYGLISNCSSSARISPGEYFVGQEIGADFSSVDK